MTLTFSDSPRWAYCAASASPVESRFLVTDDEPSEQAQEGSAAAWVADSVIRGTAASAAEFEGETAPNGWPIDHVMIGHVQGYVDTVARHGPVHSETDLSLWGGLVRGRVDSHTSIQQNALRVFEFKYGYKIIEPDTPQLILAAGALVQPHHELITLAVYQPRPHHPAGIYRKWVITPAELNTHLVRLHAAAEATFGRFAPALPGHHCEYCPRRSPEGCHALGANLYRMYELAADSRRSGKLTPGELAAELKFLDMLEALTKARRSGARAVATARLKSGGDIPGWYLKPRTGHRVLSAPPAAVQMLTGLDPYEAPKLKTPAALEREGVSPATMKLISTTPPAGLELAEWDSKAIDRAFKK